ncbi:hypothetical protein [Acinetobacter baumannii]|uniref:hypothetical protein n=1 Tax=Acinetobacter baumannii TaxID=470 RepID=UPI0024DEE22B|nr:hypothetical protein [Acinetobacter baumannii]MDK2222640.1 hypothetical protein [Acinetobacter baumannii]MDK2233530.1 hypothetical protein [Acinetobacter baumannii]HCQ9868985.1 hypothetical protein [Acinetobacter baumannii]
MAAVSLSGKATFEVEIENEDGNIEYEEISISPNEVEWDIEVHDADRQMGTEYVHIGTADVRGEEVQWLVYEYPEGILNYIDHQTNGLNLLNDFKISIEFEPE